MNQEDILQYASYALWVTLILIVILIINRKVKQRIAAKKALLNPLVILYPYEFRKASGQITFFFEADEAMEYHFFITNAETNESRTITRGICRKGGQKVQLDTTEVSNGIYFYGIETPFQRVEKRVIIEN